MVVEDLARAVIQNMMGATKSKEFVRQDYLSLQDEIRDRMLEHARSLNPNERVYWDYCLPDNLAFLYCNGWGWSRKHLEAATMYDFAKVFIFDPIPLIHDPVADEIRVEGVKTQCRLRLTGAQVYRALGYRIARVKQRSIDERLRMVLSSNSNVT
jgi:predicted ATPase